jgi:hypothetical protein
VTDINVEISDDPVSVSVSNAPGPSGASSFFKGVASAWPPSATPTAGWIYTLPDPVPTGTPAGFLAGYGAQWDGAAWTNIGPVRGPAGPAGPQGAAGTAGSPGAAGTNGTNGTNGTAATITVGSVTTGAAGTSASVVNAGTSSAAVLNITIPRGDTGAAGAAGAAGPQGPAGSAGAAGTAATVSVGTVTTGAAGSSASVTNVGTSAAAVLNITIPRGDTGAAGSAGAAGATGAAGAAATVSVGTVSTGAAGSSATVSNVGTTSAAVLNFSIPQGAAGAAGAAGSTGPAGSSGVISVTAPLTNSGTSSEAVLGITTGTTASTVCVGNDSRLSDARTPTAHTQAFSTITATPTTLTGYGITDAVGTSDSRLSDTRTPTDGSVTDAKIVSSGLSAGSINWTAIIAWAASTAYAKGDLVEYLGIAYRRTAAGTTGATFNATNWQQLTPTSFVGSQITSGTVAAARLGAHASTHQTGGVDAVASVVVTPTSLTADTNDWSIGTGDVFRVAGTAARNITGIAAGTSGLAILLVNVGSFALTLKHQSASSTAANRFTVPWAGDCVLAASGGAVVLVYDSTSSTWRVV